MDHRGRLERCTIFYNSRQCEDRVVVENWIQLLIHQKHIKHLSIQSHLEPEDKPRITLHLPPESLSHPNLESLSLGSYGFKAPHAFNNCWNLKRLKLDGIFAKIGVLNEVLMSCSSLEALTLYIISFKTSGVLKIGNPKLKFLYLSCSKIDGVEVSTHSVEFLSIGSILCPVEKFIIANPRLLQFRRNFWNIGNCVPHTTYDINCSHQEKKSIGHEFMISDSRDFKKRFATMSVSVNMTNTKEVEMLKELFVSWPEELGEIETLFKNNNLPVEEGETSIGRTHKKFWKKTRQLPNTAVLHAYCVWLSNFSGSQEEFELASHLITQGTVLTNMIIRPSSRSPSKKLEIETVVAKLKKVPTRYEPGIVLS
ncbi:unnamed protein product [Microthlaspi erraticum]|uniref:F-box/LRR-repeat protein 15/At3g58940/PEG3-like LRR domain-containing protein n=1 Tax=Microthlaspi erraticum TaxID=1685480 RepID=A0A6D2J1X3_9BRAS|nr:unnamed protein product [Microthlaspi erraticum]